MFTQNPKFEPVTLWRCRDCDEVIRDEVRRKPCPVCGGPVTRHGPREDFETRLADGFEMSGGEPENDS